MRHAFGAARREIDKLRGIRVMTGEEAREVDQMLMTLQTLKSYSRGVISDQHDPRCDGRCPASALGSCVYASQAESEEKDKIWRDSEMKKEVDAHYLKWCEIDAERPDRAAPVVPVFGAPFDKCRDLASLALAYGEASKRRCDANEELLQARGHLAAAEARVVACKDRLAAAVAAQGKAHASLIDASQKAAGCP